MEITQELVKYLFDYRKDGYLINKNPKTRRCKRGAIAGCLSKRNDGDRWILYINGRLYFRYRIIFLYHNGYLPKLIDHKNHITTDDRIENLRAATDTQNVRNRTSAKGSSSQYLGVSAIPKSKKNKFFSRVRSNGITIHLGCFDSERDAALAYNKKAIELHGEFANLNRIK